MTQRDDPLKRRPRTKRQDEIEDETEERLSRELAHLMRDPRYKGGDPDYRAYIQRQFRRVYDDPTGRPPSLRLGRPKPFVNELEPFHAERERRLRLGIEAEPASSGEKKRTTRASNRTILGGAGAGEKGRQRRATGPSLAASNRQGGKTSPASRRDTSSPVDQPLPATDQAESQTVPGPSIAHRRRVDAGMGDAIARRQSGVDDVPSRDPDFDIIPPSERALSGAEGNARRHGPDPEDARRTHLDRVEIERKLRRTLTAVEALVEIGRNRNYSLAIEFLQRYVANTGDTNEMPWPRLREYSFFRDGEKTVRGHYENWFFGDEDDKTVGQPFFSLKDGESIRLGIDGDQSLVLWEAEWNPGAVSFGRREFEDTDTATQEQDFILAFGDAEIRGYGNLAFARRGDVIYVAGRVDMRFDERYDFEDDIGLAGIATHLTLGTPNVLARELSDLEIHGLAQPFRTTSSKLWLVTGYITLVDGEPDRSKSSIEWRELDSGLSSP